MEEIKNINHNRFVYRNANDVCILNTFWYSNYYNGGIKDAMWPKLCFGQNGSYFTTPHTLKFYELHNTLFMNYALYELYEN